MISICGLRRSWGKENFAYQQNSVHRRDVRGHAGRSRSRLGFGGAGEINDAGIAVGWSDTSGADDEVTDLGTAAGDTGSEATGINDAGTVVARLLSGATYCQADAINATGEIGRSAGASTGR
ncbi:hypothetical protein [Amycolatopsis sp. cmx-11-51]|uniref:hypothetical protein n=1 Tax=unclassified Amycolatopsis TaxID=2618356 RepID=UPI0039E5F721